jgi:hypothetical protein
MACSFCFPCGRPAVIELVPAFANGSIEKKIYSIERRRDGIGDNDHLKELVLGALA